VATIKDTGCVVPDDQQGDFGGQVECVNMAFVSHSRLGVVSYHSLGHTGGSASSYGSCTISPVGNPTAPGKYGWLVGIQHVDDHYIYGSTELTLTTRLAGHGARGIVHRLVFVVRDGRSYHYHLDGIFP